MGISLRQLEYFVAVVDTGSFTQAAADLHVSQPGLSSQIMSLERQLGGPLLERLSRGVRLTPAGRIALPHARASLAHAERARTGALRAAGLDAGELHVGTLYSLSVGVLPNALRAWHTTYPDVAVRLVEFRHTHDLIEAMEAGHADVAVGPTPPSWEGPVRELGSETFWLAGPPDSGPLTHPNIPLSGLADALWVHFTPPSGLADILDTACRNAGFTPRTAVRTEQSSSALNLAKAGLGVTLVPGNVIPANFEGSLAEPLPPVQRPLSVYTRTRPDPITAAFINAIAEEVLANPGPLARPA